MAPVHSWLILLPLCGYAVRERKASTSADSWELVVLPGQINITRPAFMFLDEKTDELLVTQFGKSKKRGSRGLNLPAASRIGKIPVPAIRSMFQEGRLSGKEGYFSGSKYTRPWVKARKDLLWPNSLSRTPAEVGDYIVVPDGFLVPGKSDGHIFLADNAGELYKVTADKKGAFYHHVEWFDFNGDGRLDMLTSRVIKGGSPLRGFTWAGELVWFEQPEPEKMHQPWSEHVITEGPDVIFETMPHAGGGHIVFTTEFFASGDDVPRISMHFVSDSGLETFSREIDSTELGKPFSIHIEDVNGDGKKDLLVTNHQGPDDVVKAGVFVYEIPDDLENGPFTRHTIVQGIADCKVDDRGVGSPGFPNAFYPKVGMTGPKHIITAGDGSFDVWYSKPTGNGFEYTTEVINFQGTTGQMLLHDFDGDDIMDVLVPDNDYWTIRGLTFKQS